jgi:hypothetical protein
LDRFLTLFGLIVWPLATLLIALIFRRDLSQALGRVGMVKYRDLELTFREDLHQAEELARSIPIPPPAAKDSVTLEVALDETKPLGGRLIVPPSMPDGSPCRRDLTKDLAGSRPREAIEAAWGVLAQTSSLKRAKASTHPNLDALVGLLRSLRDRATRTDRPQPSPEDARRYVDLARQVAATIKELG